MNSIYVFNIKVMKEIDLVPQDQEVVEMAEILEKIKMGKSLTV